MKMEEKKEQEKETHFGYGRENREQKTENREENGGRKKVVGGVGRKRTSHSTSDCECEV